MTDDTKATAHIQSDVDLETKKKQWEKMDDSALVQEALAYYDALQDMTKKIDGVMKMTVEQQDGVVEYGTDMNQKRDHEHQEGEERGACGDKMQGGKEEGLGVE